LTEKSLKHKESKSREGEARTRRAKGKVCGHERGNLRDDAQEGKEKNRRRTYGRVKKGWP